MSGRGQEEPPRSEQGCNADQVGDFHVKRIILPSGKAVEIVYFDAPSPAEVAPAKPPEAGAPARDLPRLEQCQSCDGEFVYPVDWREADQGRWELELRCPSCEWRSRETYDQETVERFDDLLNSATDALIGALQDLARDNMREQIDRFVYALERDYILPFDF